MHDRYYDIRSDWPETEPALDLNAPLLTLAGLHVINDSADPFYKRMQPGLYAAVKPSGTPCDAAFPCHRNSLSKGAKIAIGVVITVVQLVIIGSLAYMFSLRRQNITRY